MRPSRLPLVALLLLCTLPSRVDAQQFVCWPIAPGDTATSLARRLMGNPAAAYSLAFQIRDPARQMFVPKSHYGRLRSDWQACVAPGPVPKAPVASAPDVNLAAWAPLVPTEPLITRAPLALTSAQLTAVHADRSPFNVPFSVPIVSAVGAAVLLFTLISTMAGSLVRRPIPPAVRRVGENFVTVFARPLIDAPSETPPIEARLKFIRRKQLLEIFIAPVAGHRYPNLTDHRKNVEYDVDRVMRVLGSFALERPPRASGKWVVVAIRPAVGTSRASRTSEASRATRDLAEGISEESNLASKRVWGPGTKSPV